MSSHCIEHPGPGRKCRTLSAMTYFNTPHYWTARWYILAHSHGSVAVCMHGRSRRTTAENMCMFSKRRWTRIWNITGDGRVSSCTCVHLHTRVMQRLMEVWCVTDVRQLRVLLSLQNDPETMIMITKSDAFSPGTRCVGP